jgi:hypothetical protein
MLERTCVGIGYPKAIRVDQGSEIISRDLDLWAYAKGVTLDFSRPGKPTDNAFIEAFNGRFRAECLNAHWFLTLNDARSKMEDWCQILQRGAPTWRHREQVPDHVANPRWRRQPATVKRPEKSNRRRSKEWERCLRLNREAEPYSLGRKEADVPAIFVPQASTVPNRIAIVPFVAHDIGGRIARPVFRPSKKGASVVST